MSPIERLIDRLRGTDLEGCVRPDRYLRYDFDEQDPKEAWSTYCELQEDLRLYGWELVGELTIEHDCITGFIDEIRKTDP